MNLAALLLILAIGLSLTMAVAWAVALRTGKSGWVDTIWSFAVGFWGIVAAFASLEGWQVNDMREIIVACMALLWSGRLGLHILGRTLSGGDDPRYAKLQQDWGKNYPRRLFWFLQVQAAAALLLVLSILIAAKNPAPAHRLADVIGIAILLIAIGGEALADTQLRRFSMDKANRGGVCEVGLWSWSRHPNYFFEFLTWFAYVAIAIDFNGAYGWGWAALAAPALMYWLLVHVSGIPLLEQHMLRSRGEKFRAYQSRVNAFFPGPPK